MLTGKHSRACDNVISLSRAPYPKGNERKYYRIIIKPSMMKRAIHCNLSMCIYVYAGLHITFRTHTLVCYGSL